MTKILKYLSVAVFLSLAYADHHLIDMTQCKYKLEPIGCFADDASSALKRAMPEQILNERDRTSSVWNGKLIHWEHFDIYLPSFLCRCADVAFKKGYSVIGAQFYGECWSGEEAHLTFDQYGLSDTCVNGEYSKNTTDITQCLSAVGTDSTNFVYRIAPTHCETYYEPVGCFKDKQNEPRPMPVYLQNERDYTIGNWNRILIDWKNWNSYSPEMICRCASAAKDKGHKMFAIQFWGECWTGSLTANFKRDGISSDCRGRDFDTCPCHSYHCVGKAYTNYVYKLTDGP